MSLSSRYGMFVCKYCNKMFHDRRQMDNHIGGKHRKNITKREKPRCRKCGADLIKGRNWENWAIRQQSLICKICKNKMNIENYYKRKKKKKIETKSKIELLKEKIRGRNKSKGDN